MGLPTLRCFLALAEERHFRHAAVRLGMSQPALSARIQGLVAVAQLCSVRLSFTVKCAIRVLMYQRPSCRMYSSS